MEFRELIKLSLNNLRKIRENNSLFEKLIQSGFDFAGGDNSIMFYMNETESENILLDFVEFYINKNARELVDWYITECCLGESEICEHSKETQNNKDEYDYAWGEDENGYKFKFNICDDETLINSLIYIKENDNEN